MAIWSEPVPSDLEDTRKLRDEYFEVWQNLPTLEYEFNTAGNRSPKFLELLHLIGEMRWRMYHRIKFRFGRDWESAIDFMNRSKFSDEFVRGTVLAKLSVHEYNGRGGFKVITQSLEKTKILFRDYPTAEMLNWWFKKEEARGFLRRHRPKEGKLIDLPSTLDWLSPEDVPKRWGKNLFWLESKVREMMLQAYLPDYLDEGEKLLPLSEAELAETTGSLLDDCLFKLSDVQEFEGKNKKELKLRESQLCKLRCRDLAFQWAREDPNLRPIDVIPRLKDTEWGAPYDQKTLRKWLNDEPIVPLKRESGRPKGKD
jgi:hypothetical protein